MRARPSHAKTLCAPCSRIENVRFGACEDSQYVKPARMHYVENGVARSWDFIESLDSVAIVLHHIEHNALLFVKQFRPALYARLLREGQESESALRHSYTFELCAGLVDKAGKSLEQIAREEVLEECGYSVKELESIGEFATAVGHSGAKQSLFYARIDEGMKASKGGGVDGEVIESVLVPCAELEAFVRDVSLPKTPGLGYGVMWFLTRQLESRSENA